MRSIYTTLDLYLSTVKVLCVVLVGNCFWHIGVARPWQVVSAMGDTCRWIAVRTLLVRPGRCARSLLVRPVIYTNSTREENKKKKYYSNKKNTIRHFLSFGCYKVVDVCCCMLCIDVMIEYRNNQNHCDMGRWQRWRKHEHMDGF